MDSYLVITVLASSLTFTAISLWYQQIVCQKNVLINIWATFSVLCGLCSFVECICLINGINGTNATGIITIWYIVLFLSSIQLTSFFTAYCLNLLFLWGHRDQCEVINDDVQPIYKFRFTTQGVLVSIGIWMLINFIFFTMCGITGYTLG